MVKISETTLRRLALEAMRRSLVSGGDISVDCLRLHGARGTRVAIRRLRDELIASGEVAVGESVRGRSSAVTDEEVAESVLDAALECLADGPAITLDDLKRHGALGSDRRIRDAMDDLVLDGEIVDSGWVPQTIAVEPEFLAMPMVLARYAPQPVKEKTLEDICADDIRQYRAAWKRIRNMAKRLDRGIEVVSAELTATGEMPPRSGLAWALMVESGGATVNAGARRTG